MKRVTLYYVVAASVLVFAGVSAAMQLTSSDAESERAEIDIVRMLDGKRVTLKDMSGSATEAINVLRDKYGVPVSFISVPNEKPEAVEFRDEQPTLRNALDEFVRSRDAYTYSLVRGHLVVYPKSGPFRKMISGIAISNKPRLGAIEAMIDHLKRTHAEFKNLIHPIVRGNPDAPLYTEPVSLVAEQANVIEHLAALLGDNPNVMFSIVDWRNSGKRFFVLEELKGSEAKRAAEAKDHPAGQP